MTARCKGLRCWLLCAGAPLLAIGRAFEPLPWEEAYAQAEETLARMDEPAVLVRGTCRRQSFVEGGLFQKQGATESGAPYYGFAGYFIYFDPHCDGNSRTPPRWVLAESPPSLDRASDLDNDGSCSTSEAHKVSSNASSPPMGTEEWQMLCDASGNLSSVNLTLRMVPEGEKFSLLRGVGWWHPEDSWFALKRFWYVGNTVAIPRLSVPSLNMQDAAQGFRSNWPEIGGSETMWPSLLSMAATWDPTIVRDFAEALGQEFKQKGANTILGPSINLHRVARGGRNFEYLTGEDPYLGSQLVTAYVKGVQSQGVLAVMKHWVFNQQETNRETGSSDVDDKTAWELYYPPFQAAVDAGVSATMCSYNRVDGDYACSNSKQLQILREKMGFKGFIQSDWWATHSTSVNIGLDQEMPGIGSGWTEQDHYQHEAYFSAERLEKASRAAVDEAVKRTLAAIYRMNLSAETQCTPPRCKEWLSRDVSTPAHVSLARSAAAKSVVLLKNERGVLPLSRNSVSTIAIIGAAANASSWDPNGKGQGSDYWATGDYYSGGGSGHMYCEVVTALQGLKRGAQELGIDVVVSATDNVTEGIAAAKRADVAIVVAGTTSGEEQDRKDLHLDGGADTLIESVQEAAARTVVLMQAPGAVVMPWHHSVDGILIMFLGGQETGNAWSDIIFGDKVPTGRLPLMLPETKADTIPVGEDKRVVYTEGMATSYRNPNFHAAYPFGHGLTYTTFEHLAPANASSCSVNETCKFRVRVSVKNTGRRSAPAIVQLYLESPAQAGHPRPLLKGFRKTASLAPNGTEEVAFELSDRDLSYFDVAQQRWVIPPGTFVAHLGESSADIRQTASFCSGGTCSASRITLFDTPEIAPAAALGGHITLSVVGGLLVACALPLAVGLLVRRRNDDDDVDAHDSDSGTADDTNDDDDEGYSYTFPARPGSDPCC